MILKQCPVRVHQYLCTQALSGTQSVCAALGQVWPAWTKVRVSSAQLRHTHTHTHSRARASHTYTHAHTHTHTHTHTYTHKHQRQYTITLPQRASRNKCLGVSQRCSTLNFKRNGLLWASGGLSFCMIYQSGNRARCCRIKTNSTLHHR